MPLEILKFGLVEAEIDKFDVNRNNFFSLCNQDKMEKRITKNA